MSNDSAAPIQWAELPPKRSRKGNTYTSKWVSWLEPLRSQPGQWAQIGKPSKYNTLQSRKRSFTTGKVHGIDPKEWEFQIRSPERAGEENYYLFVRYVGQQQQAPQVPQAHDPAASQIPAAAGFTGTGFTEGE